MNKLESKWKKVSSIYRDDETMITSSIRENSEHKYVLATQLDEEASEEQKEAFKENADLWETFFDKPKKNFLKPDTKGSFSDGLAVISFIPGMATDVRDIAPLPTDVAVHGMLDLIKETKQAVKAGFDIPVSHHNIAYINNTFYSLAFGEKKKKAIDEHKIVNGFGKVLEILICGNNNDIRDANISDPLKEVIYKAIQDRPTSYETVDEFYKVLKKTAPMQSNDLPSEPLYSSQLNENAEPGRGLPTAEEEDKGNNKAIGIILAVLILAGIGFGVYKFVYNPGGGASEDVAGVEETVEEDTKETEESEEDEIPQVKEEDLEGADKTLFNMIIFNDLFLDGFIADGFATVEGDTVYYRHVDNDQMSLAKMDLKTEKVEIIKENTAPFSIKVHDDTVYFVDIVEEFALCTINPAGEETIHPLKTVSFDILDDGNVMAGDLDEYGVASIFDIRTDQVTETFADHELTQMYDRQGEYIYFTERYESLSRFNTVTSEIEELVEGDIHSYAVTGDKLVYAELEESKEDEDMLDFGATYILDLTTMESEKIHEEPLYSVTADEDTIYFSGEKTDFLMHSGDFKGSDDGAIDDIEYDYFVYKDGYFFFNAYPEGHVYIREGKTGEDIQLGGIDFDKVEEELKEREDEFEGLDLDSKDQKDEKKKKDKK